jgi:hypothetical protein
MARGVQQGTGGGGASFTIRRGAARGPRTPMSGTHRRPAPAHDRRAVALPGGWSSAT